MSRRYLIAQGVKPRDTTDQRTGPDPTFVEGVAASFRTAIDEQDIPQADRIAEAYKPVIDALTDMGFDRATLYPFRATPLEVMGYSMGAAPAGMAMIDHAAVWRAITTARARDPKAFASLGQTQADFERNALTRQGARAIDQSAASRAGIGAQLIGGGGASFADPVNIATLPFGGGAKTIAGTILREAAINAATEAVQQPGLARNLGKMGETLTAGQAGMNIATAGVAGGVLGGVGRAVELRGELAAAATDKIADLRESAIASVWDRLPQAVRERWASAANVTDDDLPDLAEMAIGRGNMTEDERAAVAVLRRETGIAASNPFLPNGAGVAAHQDNLAAAMTRILSDVAPARAMTLRSSTGIASGTVTAPPSRATTDSVFEALIVQESGGRPGAPGVMTRYGQAHGLTQVLDSTAEAVARRIGMPWRPELMRAATDEGAAYQRAIGRGYFDEGLRRYGGDVRKALMFYHGGPDERIWGPKTRAYADQVMARTGGRVELAADIAAPAADRAAIQADIDRLRAESVAIEQATRDAAPDAEPWTPDPARPPIDDAELVPARSEPVDVAAGQPPTPGIDPGIDDATRTAVRSYVRETRGSLAPVKLARALGLAEDDARRALDDMAARGNGLVVGRNGIIRRAPVHRGPVDLLRFLAERGGIRDTEGHDLVGSGLNRFVPGIGPLIRKTGMGIDQAREAAAEAGYFHDFGPEDAMRQTTEADFLDLLEQAHGTKHYALGDIGEADAREQDARWANELRDLSDHIDARLTEHGFAFDRSRLRRAAERMQETGDDADTAIVRIVNEDLAEALDDARLEAQDDRYERLAEDIERTLAGDAGSGARGGDGPATDPGNAGEGAAGGGELRGIAEARAGGLVSADAARAFDDPDAQAAIAQVDSLDHDLRGMIDPAIADRARQEAGLKADAPMRATADQDSMIGSPLFDAADQTKLDLGDGKPVTLNQMFDDLDAEQAAIDTVRNCL